MYEFTLEINGYEVPARAEYTQYAKEWGKREAGTGLPLEPDIPAHCKVSRIEMQSRGKWVEIDLPDALAREIEDEIQAEIE